jgi:hypothetical protein
LCGRSRSAREARSLLDQQADSFLESAPLSAVRALSAGAKLGNFEIVGLLGRAGWAMCGVPAMRG